MGISTIGKCLRAGLFIALAAGSLLGCDKLGSKKGSDPANESEEDAVEEPARDVQTASFTGTWRTPWGPVTMVQTGERVSGSYSGSFTGSLEGTAKDGVAEVSWTQANGEHGRARFAIAGDGKSFNGTWGSNASATDGGPWNGTRDAGGGGLR